MVAETAEVDEGTEEDEEQYEERAWVNAIPDIRLRGEVVEIFARDYPASDKEQTDSQYGIVLRNPEPVVGELFANTQKPDDGLTRDVVDEDSTSPTDYRFVDPDDEEATFDRDGHYKSGEKSTVDGENANLYGLVDTFEEDEVLFWVSGMSADRFIRSLDFNGRPFARYVSRDDGPYLIKGLFQAHDEWFSDSVSRGQAVKNGHAPRLCRPPVLRDDVQGTDVLIDLTRHGRSYHGHIFLADQFESEVGALDTPTDELPENDYGYPDLDCEIDFRQVGFDEADEIISQYDWNMHSMFYEGPGWGEQPDGVDTSSGSFSTDLDIGGDSGVDNAAQDEEFATNVAEAMQATEAAHGRTPDEVYKQGLVGKIDENLSEWDEPPTDDRVTEIRRMIYTQVPWLDAEDVDE